MGQAQHRRLENKLITAQVSLANALTEEDRIAAYQKVSELLEANAKEIKSNRGRLKKKKRKIRP